MAELFKPLGLKEEFTTTKEVISLLELRAIQHGYKPHTVALDIFHAPLVIKKGERVGLCGPSGCGKSTLAGIAAGHIRPSYGQVLLNGQNITGLPSRKIVLVSQKSDLFPWQTVERQLRFAMEQPDEARIRALLHFAGLTGHEKKYPRELSGGMQKRLSLARALAINPTPELLILDEAFSYLDSGWKEKLQEDLRIIWQETGTSLLLITHDEQDLANLVQRAVKLTAPKQETTVQ